MPPNLSNVIMCLDIHESYKHEMEIIRDEIMALCENVAGARQAIKKLQGEKRKLRTDIGVYDCLSYCHVYQAFANFSVSDYIEARQSINKAIRNFKLEGHRWNQGIATYLKVLFLIEMKDDELNHFELGRLDGLIHDLKQEYRCVGNAVKESQCEMIIDGINEIRETISLAPPKDRSKSGKNTIPRSVAKQAQLVFDIYGAYARELGEFASNNPIGQAGIEEIILDDMRYQIFSLHNENQVRISWSGDYYWFQVHENSMNQAKPLPIIDGDFALINKSTKYFEGDIVLANLMDEASNADINIIKRLKNDGLHSESDRDIPVIARGYFEIKGVVIAIAKPKELLS